MSREEKHYTFVVSGKQLYIIRAALDFYMRIGMGQLEVLEEFLRRRFYGRYFEKKVTHPQLQHLTRGTWVLTQIRDIKLQVFGHHPNGSWGIRSEEVPQACREAYDIRQIVGHALNKERVETHGASAAWDVDSREYWATNPDDPPIKVGEVTLEDVARLQARIQQLESLNPETMPDEMLCGFYLKVGWEDPGNADWPDPSIAADVRAMLLAPTVDAALEVIEYWGPGGDLQRERVTKLRALVAEYQYARRSEVAASPGAGEHE